MSGSKHFNKLAWVVTALVLVITILFMSGSALGLEVMNHTIGYENRLFDNTRVHTIDIVMDDWDGFIANASSEEYYTASVVIDGEAYKHVGIRGKGNTSLSTVSTLGSERYSFKIEFDQYDNSLSYHGLDKLSLNNLIQDSTMMKDYLTYTMMNEFGATAPLCSFVYITVNGEDWGLYLAVEGVEDSFLERNYGSDYGELYKPDSMSFGGGRGNGQEFDMDEFMSNFDTGSSSGGSMPSGDNFDPSSIFGGSMPGDGSFDPSSMFGGEVPDMGSFDPSRIPASRSEGESQGSDKSSFSAMMGGFGMGSSDVKLQYIDDNISSYSNIWNNAKTNITVADRNRLISSLKQLSGGEEIESVVDIEQVIRYFVVHNYVCNGDSYTGSMIHNYYLYEENGRLAMLPWDYNLAYGTFQGDNGQSTVNTPIDAPVSGSTGEDRPMWSWILSDESYTERYHQYFAEFLNTVDVQAIIDNAYNLITSYVEKDPTAFYSYAEFEAGVETLRQFCALRSESISMQLENGETTSNMGYVDASALSLSTMGSMSMGGGFGDRQSTGDSSSEEPAKDESTSSGWGSGSLPNGMNPGSFGGQMPNSGKPPEGMDPSQIPGGMGGSLPDGFDPSQIPGGMGGMFPGQSSGNTGAPSTGNSGTSGNTDPSGSSSNRPSGGNMQMPGGNFGSMGGTSSDGSSRILLVISVIILCVGILIAKRYK